MFTGELQYAKLFFNNIFAYWKQNMQSAMFFHFEYMYLIFEVNGLKG